MKLLRLNRWITTALLSGLLTVANLAHAEHALQDYVNNLKTFSAHFEQTQPDDTMFVMNKSSGYFELNRPGQLVWKYFKPTPQKIVVDGINLWVFDEDLDQVTVRPIEDVKADIPLSWLLYSESIESKFDIIDVGERSGMSWYNLSPKRATYFQSIEVGLKGGELTEVWMYQSPENITKVRFSEVQSNHIIPLKNFRFELPEGVDLVGEAL